jgi:hypothetical protein
MLYKSAIWVTRVVWTGEHCVRINSDNGITIISDKDISDGTIVEITTVGAYYFFKRLDGHRRADVEKWLYIAEGAFSSDRPVEMLARANNSMLIVVPNGTTLRLSDGRIIRFHSDKVERVASSDKELWEAIQVASSDK